MRSERLASIAISYIYTKILCSNRLKKNIFLCDQNEQSYDTLMNFHPFSLLKTGILNDLGLCAMRPDKILIGVKIAILYWSKNSNINLLTKKKMQLTTITLD